MPHMQGRLDQSCVTDVLALYTHRFALPFRDPLRTLAAHGHKPFFTTAQYRLYPWAKAQQAVLTLSSASRR